PTALAQGGGAAAPPARAAGPLSGVGGGEASRAPVTFMADEVEYDRNRGVVTARGHVEAWQGERLLRADEFTYDRNTGVATARGHVELLEPDGQVLFADEAELKDRFRDGVLLGVRALLAANGKLAANGARRTGGTINELARAVYTSCDLCADDPTAPPLWQVQARRATQNKQDLRITYRDAQVRFFGVPVLYTPYLSHPDPAAPRASGFLFPQFGYTRFLGALIETPYYWAIDGSSDLTVTPLFSTRQDPNTLLEYRKRFNFGEIAGQASIGGFNGTDSAGQTGLAGHIFMKGRFSIDEHWRAGFDANRATSQLYLQTFRFEYQRVLTSQAYLEGFWGTEGYARFDARIYQGLRTTDDVSQIPYVLPNLYYERAPREQVLGGWLTLDSSLYGIYRTIGSQAQRLAARLYWERPEVDPVGGVWTFRLLSNARGYHALGQGNPPDNLPDANGTNAVGNIRAAVDWRMPFVRSAGSWGTQVIEPRVQFVTGPKQGRQTNLPNEDSVDLEFTDANLFALNRFPGLDRQEGGTRVDGALRGAWNFPNGGQIEGLFGRSYRLINDDFNPYPNTGLERRGSDYVARLSVSPVSWLDVTGRIRLDGRRPLERRLADTVATLSLGPVSLYAGYLYAPPVPFLNPIQARDEVSGGFTARIGPYWRVSAGMRYDLGLGKPVLIQGVAGYEDECFILEARLLKRYAIDPTTNTNFPSSTIVLVRIGLKTLGDYFLRAI
ncbi:MAG TPA: LPS assembly protein LptD, partial [Crenalkalicoccus sp.]|nr:LPS assembly protein LptD [Crenalkalicoccus sp.]